MKTGVDKRIVSFLKKRLKIIFLGKDIFKEVNVVVFASSRMRDGDLLSFGGNAL